MQARYKRAHKKDQEMCKTTQHPGSVNIADKAGCICTPHAADDSNSSSSIESPADRATHQTLNTQTPSASIAQATQRLYVLGHPIAHSKSPAMYNAVYAHMGLPWIYDLADLACEDDARSFLEQRNFLSINVTTPYKVLAYEYATAKAASAKLAGGANLLVAKEGALLAFNTDGEGCVENLRRAGLAFQGARVVVCGTGPTSCAILHACALAGADDLVLLSRDKARSQAVLERYVDTLDTLAFSPMSESLSLDKGRDQAAKTRRSFREVYEQVHFRFGSYERSRKAIVEAKLIINATPLGMHEGDPAPFDTNLLHAKHTVFDVVYGHGETSLLAAARRAGAQAYDGSGMLVAQAVATIGIVTDLAGIECLPSTDELFVIMKRAFEKS